VDLYEFGVAVLLVGYIAVYCWIQWPQWWRLESGSPLWIRLLAMAVDTVLGALAPTVVIALGLAVDWAALQFLPDYRPGWGISGLFLVAGISAVQVVLAARAGNRVMALLFAGGTVGWLAAMLVLISRV
jgi:hypothetical protein